MNRIIKSLICFGVPFTLLWAPADMFGIPGLSTVEQRVIAIFFMAALCWVLEPIPAYATSLLIIVLMLVMISDKGLSWLIISHSGEPAGTLIPYADLMAVFASPIILLFLGGFFLALAATKYRLDQNLARVLLKPFGTKPSQVMLGIMLITAIFSMFMSNTATTAMMLAILVPVLALFETGDKGKIAFALSVPVAANIGGRATPIGTPPNAIAMKYLTGEDYISFGEWMAFSLPLVLLLLLVAWLLLLFFFPMKSKSLKLDMRGKFLRNRKAYIVYITFAITLILWLTDFVHGMNSFVVAMIPVAVFSSTSIVTKEDLKILSWDVLWLIAGGIALGLALERTGLAQKLVTHIPFETFSPLMVVFFTSLIALVMANFMSHTATANLLLPIVAALATSLTGLQPYGGEQMFIITVTFSCSLAMVLPISTPPNALAYGLGIVKTKDMAIIGVLVGVIGLIMTYAMVYILNLIQYFS
jgi:solute carrier family 13 (sodium-dependent dicarboxylate transporter), member 2/3/5